MFTILKFRNKNGKQNKFRLDLESLKKYRIYFSKFFTVPTGNEWY